ncbi:MAG: formylglycine-generating enzyme family protein, partial [bacterium]|nr:formylglycine-generating enzyme family protein [bacterium]
SWEDAKTYCEWLSKKTGVSFKLPTEAQWEKAARGTDGRKYPWGEQEPNKNLANFNQDIGKTSPVGSYPKGASPYELLDMAGNVWEWCGDWYAGYSSDPQTNPAGPAGGSFRVVRGGGWDYSAGGLRCSFRIVSDPSVRGSGLGFRLCQDNK